MIRLALAAALMVSVATNALADRRLALVVGNDEYQSPKVPSLVTATSDAKAITAQLRATGFEVTQVLNSTERSFNRALSEFTETVQEGDTVMFYYAGHAVEIGGENFLLQVDVPDVLGKRGLDIVRDESIPLLRVLERLRSTGANISIAIIDACRNNPFEDLYRSADAGQGLANIDAPEGTFVLFSAGAGQMALDRLHDDDSNPNSVFTRSLLPLIDQEGLELREMVKKLRRDVVDLASTVDEWQMPAYYDEMLGDFSFVPGAPKAKPVQAEDTPVQTAPRTTPEPEVTAKEQRPTAQQIVLPAIDQVQEPALVDANLGLDREMIRWVQSRLLGLGFNPKGVDGVLGPNTRRALSAWQYQTGRTPTGYLSQKDVAMLHPQPETIERPVQVTRAEPIQRRGTFQDTGSDRYIDANGCARSGNGAVLACPLTVKW